MKASTSLGVAPWTLVFARLTRGPLSILKETWEGVVDSPLYLGKNTVEFLRDMQNKLETVRSYAQEHNAEAQQRRVSRYNLRAKEKQFVVGDSVLLLCPDSTASRTFRWQGPGRVVEVRSPHSYVVDLNGTKHHVHANRLKRFLVSSDSVVIQPDLETICSGVKSCAICTHRDDSLVCDGCAVINDCDSDFGDVHTFEQSESKSISPPSQKN